MKNNNDEKNKNKKPEQDRCVIADHPEMVRNNYEDEPCDDNRA